jgi:hypothetical protein
MKSRKLQGKYLYNSMAATIKLCYNRLSKHRTTPVLFKNFVSLAEPPPINDKIPVAKFSPNFGLIEEVAIFNKKEMQKVLRN